MTPSEQRLLDAAIEHRKAWIAVNETVRGADEKSEDWQYRERPVYHRWREAREAENLAADVVIFERGG